MDVCTAQQSSNYLREVLLQVQDPGVTLLQRAPQAGALIPQALHIVVHLHLAAKAVSQTYTSPNQCIKDHITTCAPLHGFEPLVHTRDCVVCTCAGYA